jgi:hypothetical protein
MIRCLIAFLQMLILIPGIVWAADSGAENCPPRTQRYKAQLIQTHLTGTAGELVILNFSLDPPEPPHGFFLSVKMDALQGPEAAKRKNPEILTGFPETSLLFHVPGVYRYGVVVSLIFKPSCGGVTADTVFEGDVRIDIKP